MKAIELQIGDFFQVAENNICIPKGTIVEIHGIDADDWFNGRNLVRCRPLGQGQSTCEIWLDYLEPIPLTPEILGKNFEKVRGVENHYGLSDDYSEVVISEVTDSIWQGDYANCEAHFPVCRNLVCHVHQLQHVLRLLGIDLEIKI